MRNTKITVRNDVISEKQLKIKKEKNNIFPVPFEFADGYLPVTIFFYSVSARLFTNSHFQHKIGWVFLSIFKTLGGFLLYLMSSSGASFQPHCL